MRRTHGSGWSVLSLVLLGGAVGMAAGLWPAWVSADAVPPAPESCPRGYIPVTSHAGPQCVLKPPISCPPGWRGINGGICVVHACETDAHCGWGERKDLRCKPARVCIHEYLQEYGEGGSQPVERDERALFAGPPRRFDPPRRVQELVDVCPDRRACPAGSTCGEKKICLPADLAAPGLYQRPKLPPSPLYPSSPPQPSLLPPAT